MAHADVPEGVGDGVTAVGKLANGVLADRIGSRQAITLFLALQTAMSPCFYGAWHPGMYYVIGALFGIGMGGFMPDRFDGYPKLSLEFGCGHDRHLVDLPVKAIDASSPACARAHATTVGRPAGIMSLAAD